MTIDEAMEFIADALCEERAVLTTDIDPAIPNEVRVYLDGTVLVLTVRIETP